MNFRRWKLGLLVACLSGIFGAVTTLGIVKDVGGWKQLLLILAIGISKDGLLFLKSHPVETLPPDKDLNGTAHFTEAKSQKQDGEK